MSEWTWSEDGTSPSGSIISGSQAGLNKVKIQVFNLD